MNDNDRDQAWPPAAGDPADLPREVLPPTALEDAVTAELLRRSAIRPAGVRARRARGVPAGWAVAASLALLMLGFGVGRRAVAVAESPIPTPETAAYALLLFESEGFDRAKGAERRTRYDEYSRWVAEARRRGQFVAGEDLSVDGGWVMAPGSDATGERQVAPGVRVAEAPALSGIFFIAAADDEQALTLAESLPHLMHGGHVVIQRTIPTDRPPAASP